MNELTSEYDKMYDDIYDSEEKSIMKEESIVSDVFKEVENENNSSQLFKIKPSKSEEIRKSSLNELKHLDETLNNNNEKEELINNLKTKEIRTEEWEGNEREPLLADNQDIFMHNAKKNDETKIHSELKNNNNNSNETSLLENDNELTIKEEEHKVHHQLAKNKDSSEINNKQREESEESNKAQPSRENVYEKEQKEETNVRENENKSKDNESRSTFECNICFDDVRDPVVTKCGHLFCWLCLSSWIKKNKDCPVCKAEVSKENVIPLYGRGKSSNDHKYKNADEEPRPTPKRKESVRRNANGNNLGLRASFGVWVNPFSFGLSYTNMSEEPYFNGENRNERRVQTETFHAEAASSFFFFLGFFLSLYILFYSS